MRTRHVFVSHVTKQHVNKKKAIKSKSRPSIYVSLNSRNDIFAELELEKIKLISHV